MKNEFYARSFLLLLLLTVFSYRQSYAQCSCSGGNPANLLTYYYVLDTTDAASSTISFPKFDPSVGTLNCIVFNDTLSGITTTGVRNLVTDTSAPYYNIYRFLLSIANDISGPGISVNDAFTTTYGPDTLMRKGFPGDSTTHGPDQIFTNSFHQNTTSNVSPYLGSSGNVNFVYTLNGGLIALQGGLNYGSHIETRYWGAFRLTYYWCPTSLLPVGLRDFYLARNQHDIRLVWDINQENPDNKYVVEYSTDGKNFSSLGTVPANTENGSYAKYEYQYQADDQQEGYLSFRIRQVEASGIVRYSQVRTVLLEPTDRLSFQTSPNPANHMLNVFFYKPTTGDFDVKLVNISGQVMYQKDYRVQDQYSIHVSWPDKIAPGLYFLKVVDKSRQLQRISKVLIQ